MISVFYKIAQAQQWTVGLEETDRAFSWGSDVCAHAEMMTAMEVERPLGGKQTG